MIELYPNKCILPVFFQCESRSHQSNLFSDTVRKAQLFGFILENLEINDLLSIAFTCKLIKKIVENNPFFQNKILRAKVQYFKSANKKNFPFLPIVEQLPYHLIFDGDFRNLFMKKGKIKKASEGILKGSVNKLRTNFNSFDRLNKEKQKELENRVKETKRETHNTTLMNQMENIKRVEIEEKMYEDSMNWRVKLVQRMELSRSDLKDIEKKERDLLGKLENDIHSKHYKIIEPDDSCYLTKVTFWDRIIYRLRDKF